ncbi:MAG: helix-turn-helix domain-containing protein [Candidatus Omnitrophota bacterium]
MPNTQQLEFPFFSLDFRDRATLRVGDVARKLGCCEKHVFNLIESGKLGCINIGAAQSRQSVRIPIEAYRDFILRNFSGEARKDFVRTLPTATLELLFNELAAAMADKRSLRK